MIEELYHESTRRGETSFFGSSLYIRCDRNSALIGITILWKASLLFTSSETCSLSLLFDTSCLPLIYLSTCLTAIRDTVSGTVPEVTSLVGIFVRCCILLGFHRNHETWRICRNLNLTWELAVLAS